MLKMKCQSTDWAEYLAEMDFVNKQTRKEFLFKGYKTPIDDVKKNQQFGIK